MLSSQFLLKQLMFFPWKSRFKQKPQTQVRKFVSNHLRKMTNTDTIVDEYDQDEQIEQDEDEEEITPAQLIDKLEQVIGMNFNLLDCWWLIKDVLTKGLVEWEIRPGTART